MSPEIWMGNFLNGALRGGEFPGDPTSLARDNIFTKLM